MSIEFNDVTSCLARGTLVRLANGKSVPVEELQVGMLLSGQDGRDVRVTDLEYGASPRMFRIEHQPLRHLSNSGYTVTPKHRVTLTSCKNEHTRNKLPRLIKRYRAAAASAATASDETSRTIVEMAIGYYSRHDMQHMKMTPFQSAPLPATSQPFLSDHCDSSSFPLHHNPTLADADLELELETSVWEHFYNAAAQYGRLEYDAFMADEDEVFEIEAEQLWQQREKMLHSGADDLFAYFAARLSRQSPLPLIAFPSAKTMDPNFNDASHQLDMERGHSADVRPCMGEYAAIVVQRNDTYPLHPLACRPITTSDAIKLTLVFDALDLNHLATLGDDGASHVTNPNQATSNQYLRRLSHALGDVNLELGTKGGIVLTSLDSPDELSSSHPHHLRSQMLFILRHLTHTTLLSCTSRSTALWRRVQDILPPGCVTHLKYGRDDDTGVMFTQFQFHDHQHETSPIATLITVYHVPAPSSERFWRAALQACSAARQSDAVKSEINISAQSTLSSSLRVPLAAITPLTSHRPYDYVSVSVSGNHRYQLSSGILTHNSMMHAGGSILRTSKQQLSTPQHVDNCLRVLQHHRVRYLVTIGGTQTAFSASLLATAANEAKYKLSVVHCPKSIFSDMPLGENIKTFGFSTARDKGAEIVHNLASDARTMLRWYILVCMGAYAGHLTLGIAKAGAATVTILAEDYINRPPTQLLTFKELVSVLEAAIYKRRAMNKEYGVAVLSEGLASCLSHDEMVERFGDLDTAHSELGRHIVLELQKRFAKRSPPIEQTVVARNIGNELRSAPPNASDIILTRDLGFAATRVLMQGGTELVVTLKGGQIAVIPFSSILDPAHSSTQIRRVDTNSLSYQVAQSYSIVLRQPDLQDIGFLQKLSRAANMTPSEFILQFQSIAMPMPNYRQPQVAGINYGFMKEAFPTFANQPTPAASSSSSSGAPSSHVTSHAAAVNLPLTMTHLTQQTQQQLSLNPHPSNHIVTPGQPLRKGSDRELRENNSASPTQQQLGILASLLPTSTRMNSAGVRSDHSSSTSSSLSSSHSSAHSLSFNPSLQRISSNSPAPSLHLLTNPETPSGSSSASSSSLATAYANVDTPK